MTVVSNTSPLNYLVLIDYQEILPVTFGHVLIPEVSSRTWALRLGEDLAPLSESVYSYRAEETGEERPCLRSVWS